jgi:hypothetical protein
MDRIPDSLPVLGRGRHRSPARGACFLEYTSLLAGEPFSDAPRCVDGELAAVLRHANDVLSDADRPRLLPLLGRGIGLAARDAARLRAEAARRFTIDLGVPLSAEEQRYARRGAVDRLFWSLMLEPVPVSTSAAWVDRLVGRLELLHACYEGAVLAPVEAGRGA